MWEFLLLAPICLKQEAVRNTFDGRDYRFTEQCHGQNVGYHINPQVFTFPTVMNNIYKGTPNYFNFDSKSFGYKDENIKNYFYDGNSYSSGTYDDVPFGLSEGDIWWEPESTWPMDHEDVFDEGYQGLQKSYHKEQHKQHSRYMNEHEEFGEVNFGKVFHDGLGLAGHYVTKPYEDNHRIVKGGG